MFLVSTIVCTAILHDDEIACLNFVTAWSRQQGRRSVKGPDTFRLSSFVVGSNVRVIVSLGLARKYIYGREICLLSVGPLSLNSGRSDRNVHVRTSHRRCSNSKWAPGPSKVSGLSLVSDSYLVDDASSHMLVSKIRLCAETRFRMMKSGATYQSVSSSKSNNVPCVNDCMYGHPP